MTILQYITPSRIGGAERYFLLLVDSLRQAGHRVLVVTKRDTPLRKLLEQHDVELHGWLTRGKLDLLTLGRLRRLIKKERVDLINTHLTTASLLGAVAGRLTGKPVVAWVHATDPKTFFQFADRLIAVSSGVQQHLLEQGVPAHKIHLLYYGMDCTLFDNPLPAAEAKLRLGLAPHARTVGVVASLQWRKGHRFLLQALERIARQVGEVHALFCGEGDQEQALREQAAALGLNDRVHFLGFREDVTEVVSAFDIFVLPSSKEGLSIAVMEAMALKRPVIATSIAGMPEVVKPGETGLLVPPEDVDALSKALLALLKNQGLAEQLGASGRDLLQSKFDQKQCLRDVDHFLCSVVRQWNEPAGPLPLK